MRAEVNSIRHPGAKASTMIEMNQGMITSHIQAPNVRECVWEREQQREREGWGREFHSNARYLNNENVVVFDPKAGHQAAYSAVVLLSMPLKTLAPGNKSPHGGNDSSVDSALQHTRALHLLILTLSNSI